MEQANTYTYLNGKIILSEKASILTNDRGFLYGDGLYETIRIHQGKPFLWEWHMTRLIAGAEIIDLKLPLTSSKLLEELKKLIQKNNLFNCIARLTITRGPGERGFGLSGREIPTVLITLHTHRTPQEKAITLSTTNIRVAKGDVLTTIKSNNKLNSVMAKYFAKEKNTNDGLILNSDNNITETSSANIFWIKNNIIKTPPISDGVLPGITRRLVFRLVSKTAQEVKEESLSTKKLKQADSVFVTSAATGIRTVKQIDNNEFREHYLINQLIKTYESELPKYTCPSD